MHFGNEDFCLLFWREALNYWRVEQGARRLAKIGTPPSDN